MKQVMPEKCNGECTMVTWVLAAYDQQQEGQLNTMKKVTELSLLMLNKANVTQQQKESDSG